MKRRICWIVPILIALALAGCGGGAAERFTRSWYDAFDTVVTLTAYAGDAETFERAAAAFAERLYHLHAVFDRFAPHEGVRGLYALNAAGGAWVEVEPEMYDLLESLRDWGAGGRVNPALGAVVSLWTQARAAGEGLPDGAALAAAAQSADFGALEMQNGRVRLRDARTVIDLGAVAKGYAARLLGETVGEYLDSYLIDAGGNVVCGVAPADGRDAWRVGVVDPDGGGALLVLNVAGRSVVTSGDYQRYYTVDGVRYHHLIDPDTLYPARFMRQATVLADDAGYADYLSTLLFLTPVEEALRLAEALEGVEAILVDNDGAIRMTTGAEGWVD